MPELHEAHVQGIEKVYDETEGGGRMSGVLHWYDDICCPRCKGRVNSWDKRISRALKYKSIVCEKCIAKEYDMDPEELRRVMQTEMGLVPCPGL